MFINNKHLLLSYFYIELYIISFKENIIYNKIPVDSINIEEFIGNPYRIKKYIYNVKICRLSKSYIKKIVEVNKNYKFLIFI